MSGLPSIEQKRAEFLGSNAHEITQKGSRRLICHYLIKYKLDK